MTQLVVSVKDNKNASIIKELLKDLSFIEQIEEISDNDPRATSKDLEANVRKHIQDLKKQHKEMTVNVQWKD